MQNSTIYDSTTFYYMSGTGNSLKVAKWMAEHSEKVHTDTCLRSVEEANPVEEVVVGEKNLVGLVFPTHGFTAPWHMLKFLVRMPRKKNTHAVISATRAGLKFRKIFFPGISGSSLFIAAILLFLKGYTIRGLLPMDMPSNWMSLHSGLKKDAANAIIDRAKKRTKLFSARIHNGKTDYRSGWLFYEFIWGVLLSWLSALYLVIGRFFLAKLFYANSSCNSCGLCEEYCPVGAVQFRGKDKRPYWQYHCESCMRCMGYCPHQAIEAHQSWGIGIWLVGTLLADYFLVDLFGDYILKAGNYSGIITNVLKYLIFLTVILFSYNVLQLITRFAWFNKLFSFLTLTHYYRRYHEPETKLKSFGQRKIS